MKNILQFLKVILLNNKKRVFSLLSIYILLNIIFLWLIFVLVNFNHYLEKNSHYNNELSLKRNLIEEDEQKDMYYKDYNIISKIVWKEWHVYKNYFFKIPTYIKVKFFNRKFETDMLLHVYDFSYLWVNIKNNNTKILPLLFSSDVSLLLENMISSNFDYKKIMQSLEWKVFFWKNSFIKHNNIVEEKFNIAWFNSKLSIYSVAVDEKHLKKILPQSFFNDDIRLHEINIVFKNKKLLLEYKKILWEKWYNFSLKNEEFEKMNKKLHTIYYYFFTPVFWIFFVLLFMIVHLNLENSQLKNKDIIQVLHYLRAQRMYVVWVFYLEFLSLFILSLCCVLLSLYWFNALFEWSNLLQRITSHYFTLDMYIEYVIYLYVWIFAFSFMKTFFSFKK